MNSDLVISNVQEIKNILKNINWGFYPQSITAQKNKMLFNCRKYHWYPATFIPEIPYTLIELLTKPGAKVLDPFCGIGTSYFQALILNRIPFGIDICSFSIEFMKLLLRLFDPHLDLYKIQKSTENKNSRF